MAWHENSVADAGRAAQCERYLVDPDAVRAELGRILAAPLFARSKRCTSLLQHIVEKTLGGAEDLKERTIGVDLFGRAPDYDTNEDPTVRIAAAEVRKRLTLYYSDQGSPQELRIELPVHSYLAEFRVSEAHPVPLDAVPAQTQTDGKYRTSRRWSTSLLLSFPILGLIAWATYHLLSPVSALDKFWMPVLDAPSQILLGVSSPLSSVPPGPQNPNTSVVAAPGLSFRDFTNQHSSTVAMSDVTAANGVAAFLRTRKKNSNLGPANALTMWDLRANPAVMFGTFDNYWATKLGANLRFRFVADPESGKRWIGDANDPGDRAWMLDMSAPVERVDSDYALISRVLDPLTGQWWIGIAGMTGVATVAAEQWITDPKAIGEATAGLPKGWERKDLQIVLGVNLVEGNPGNTRVLKIYAW